MAKIPAQTALATIDGLLCSAKEILRDAHRVASDGEQGNAVLQIMALIQAVTDVQADVRARLALKAQRS